MRYQSHLRAGRLVWLSAVSAAILWGCGGGSGSSGSSGSPSTNTTAGAADNVPTDTVAASRLMHQASFGPTLKGVAEIQTKGPKRWITEQFALPVTQYTVGSDFIHKGAKGCDDGTFDEHYTKAHCGRDNYFPDPLMWEFYRQALTADDQLRGRVALALSEILVGQGVGSNITYGMRIHQQIFRDKAFSTFPEILRAFTLSPITGHFINSINNDGKAPNLNFGREFLQLFSVGPCLLNRDGSLKEGRCKPTYSEAVVANYAYAFSGMTYPAGGYSIYPPNPKEFNTTYFGGPMVLIDAKHDNPAAIAAGVQRALLAGVTIPASNNAQSAFNEAMRSAALHSNMAPFISKQLIQRLVTSNPKPAYVARVADAFDSGKFGDIGSGSKGDMKAVIAAILLDPEARDPAAAADRSYGKLKEPILFMTSLYRAFEGSLADGREMGPHSIGEPLGQMVFEAPTVFNFFSPDSPLPGANSKGLVAPEFQINGSNELVARANFDDYLLFREYNAGRGVIPRCDVGLTADAQRNCPLAKDGKPRYDSPWDTGSRLEYKTLTDKAADASAFVRWLNTVFAANALPEKDLLTIINAISKWTPASDTANNSDLVNVKKSNYLIERTKLAMYLIRKSGYYQIQR